jgi:hypothetical protein
MYIHLISNNKNLNYMIYYLKIFTKEAFCIFVVILYNMCDFLVDWEVKDDHYHRT